MRCLFTRRQQNFLLPSFFQLTFTRSKLQQIHVKVEIHKYFWFPFHPIDLCTILPPIRLTQQQLYSWGILFDAKVCCWGPNTHPYAQIQCKHILMHKCSVNISLCTNAVYTYPYAQIQCIHILMHKYRVNISLCTNAVYTYPYAHTKAANDRWSRWPKSPLLPWLWLGLGRPAPTWNQDWSILLKVPYRKHILESRLGFAGKSPIIFKIW